VQLFLLVAGLALGATACGDDDGDGDAQDSAGAAAVRFVSQNILHGSACAPETNNCAVTARVELFVRQLDDAGCPQLVGLQEANVQIVKLLEDKVATICDGTYRVVYDEDPGNDREVVLTNLEVIGTRRERLPGPLRSAFWVRAASDAGVVDFITTHLASGSDDRPCDTETCPPPCEESDMLGTCQAKQLVDLVNRLAHPDAVVVIGGDLNAKPDEPTIAAIRGAGFVDTHLAAGNKECDRATGANCTSGRIDDALTDMRDPQSKQSERIDYLWLGTKRKCNVEQPTGLFNGDPVSNGPSGLAFPADHTGIEATVRCDTTNAQRDATADAALPTVPPTTAGAAGSGDAATKAEITTAYETLFNGDVTDLEVKLQAVEDAERLRTFFMQTFEATKDLSSQITVRIDDIDVVDDTNADVVYTLLLQGSAVFDHVPGRSVKVDGRWLVARRTFCDVATQGAETIPEPCRN
jgi:endonuclease/exonuclease/phosphatase family metal-dependent hydrolase